MNLGDLAVADIQNLADNEKIYQRGLEYFESNLVIDIELDGNTIYAEVFGTETYEIRIDDDLSCVCTCPYEGIHCKHMVAVLLNYIKDRKELLKQRDKNKNHLTNLKRNLMLLEKKELVDLLISSTKKQNQWKSVLLQDATKKISKVKPEENLDELYLQQYQILSKRVFKIIHYHDEYGGGPDDEYDEVDELLNKISELFKGNRLPEDIRQSYLSILIKHYESGNAGMDDILSYAIKEISRS